MAKQLKTWTTLGIAALSSATLAQSAPLASGNPAPAPNAIILAQAESDAGGEGGENGGEGGGAAVTTYTLGSTSPDAYRYEAKPQIEAYADLVHTAYSRAAADAATLKSAIDAFLGAPSPESLSAARQAWVAARPAYLRTEAFRFYDGPIEEVEAELNAWPLNEAYIDYVEGNTNAGLVNDPKFTLDARSLEQLNQKQDDADVTTGWHAIEFLLWGQDLSAAGPGNRPYTDYIPGKGNNDQRRLYLELAAHKLAGELEELAQSWKPDGAKNYAANFLALPEREAIGRMVNGMAILAGFELMSERLAVALDSGDQEDEHSCFSDTTKQDFTFDLAGIKQVWTGDGDGKARAGLDELVRSQDVALAARIDTLFADAEAKVNALGDPWDQVLAAPKDSPQRKAAEELVTALQALSDGIVEAGNKLGVLVLVPTG
jgi:putative iron-regulated protein